MNWNNGWRTVLALSLLLLLWPAMAAERTNKTRIDPHRHTVQELANADAQVVIDTTLTYVTLDSAEIDSSLWIPLQEGVWTGYPSLANYIIRLDSGKVAAWFLEYYWGGIPRAAHYDSTHILWATNDPLQTVGQWVVPLSFYGGWRLRVYIKALADNTGFQAGYQTMRD